MIIEDEPIYQKLIASALRDTGLHIDIAGDGFSAIEKFNPSVHELAIVDLVLPGPINGLELIKKLRHLKPDLKVLVCSGYANQTILHKLEKAGAGHYITKPFTPDLMLNKVRSMLENSSGSSTPAPPSELLTVDVPHDTVPDIFNHFNPGMIRELCKLGKHSKLSKHSRTGMNHTATIMIVLSGAVRCYDHQNMLCIMGAGKCLGYESMARDVDPDCVITIEALQETQLCMIDKLDFLQYFSEQSDQVLNLLQENVKKALPDNPIFQRFCARQKNTDSEPGEPSRS